MNELITCCTRQANKNHTCILCGGTIKNGEIYIHVVNKYDGEIMSSAEHVKCNEIANEISDYIDADDDGISEEEFLEGVEDICKDFICPYCDNFNHDDPWCEDCKEAYGCSMIDKVYDLLQDNELYRSLDMYGRFEGWSVREKPYDANY